LLIFTAEAPPCDPQRSRGLPYIYATAELRDRVFAILAELSPPGS
jgi:hypothetical protein